MVAMPSLRSMTRAACALVAFGLASWSAVPVAAAATTDAAWDATVAQFIEAHFVANPSSAVYAGRHEFDGRLPDLSGAALQRDVARLEAARTRVLAVDASALTEDRRREREFLLAAIDVDLFWKKEAEWPYRNPAYYLGVIDPEIYLSKPYAPLETRMRAYIGHGAGHSQIDKLKEAFGAKEIEGFHTLDPIASQLLDPKKLKPGVGDLTAEMVKRYKTLYDKDVADRAIAPHVSMGFNNMWILLNDVVPRAITKYGGFGPEALAKAARDTDIPEGGTMQGYGVKFNPPGHRFAGQNQRSFPAVFEIIEGKFELVFPKTVATAAPLLPLPASSPLAVR